ncbi:MAG TPA: hypothetical protein VMW38_22685 [Terriglobia bacterium]|nr:hypothetical protein [Terriglobia bacterium]
MQRRDLLKFMSSSVAGLTILKSGRIVNAPEANDYLKPSYRPYWTLNG